MCAIAVLLLFAPAASDLAQGLAALQRGDHVAAQAALSRAVQVEPSPRAWKALGVAFASVEDYTRAEPAFAEACRAEANEEDACYYWARSLYALNRFELSLRALDRVPGQSPRPWRITLARAEALAAVERTTEAKELFGKALRQRLEDPAPPGHIDPLLAYVRHLYRQGDLAHVLHVLRTAPPTYQTLPAWHYQLGRALAQLGKLDEAVSAFQQAILRQPEYPEAHAALSRACYRLGDAERGAFHARRAGGSSTVR